MEIKRRREIFVTTSRRFYVRLPDPAEQFFCSECGDAAAPMLAAEQIAVLFGISRRRAYQLVETSAPHFVENGNGILFVCPNSLAEILEKKEI